MGKAARNLPDIVLASRTVFWFNPLKKYNDRNFSVNFYLPMYSWNLEKERLDAEAYLSGGRTDFVATYMTVSNLQYILAQSPDAVTAKTADALHCVLNGPEHAAQRQAYFLYKKAADALAGIIEKTTAPDLSYHARNRLFAVLRQGKEKPRRAAAEALGTLPLKIKGPRPKGADAFPWPEKPLPEVSWESLLESAQLAANPHRIKWRGRSMVVNDRRNARLLVVKTARPGDDPALLLTEALWMAFFCENREHFPGKDLAFHIPRPLPVVGNYLFEITHLPKAAHKTPLPAIAFFADPGYFRYPNEPRKGRLPHPNTFYDIITRNALILGRLAGQGIVHTAPIPLFHNRVQRHRREDRGVYQWPRAGRLDQWLNSCRFPNIGMTGVRDFEHLTAVDAAPRRLYECIGSHILSLVLIIGSYFRNQEPSRRGRDTAGGPVDARDLFDPDFFRKTLSGVFEQYYQGFTGNRFRDVFPLDLDNLTGRLIDEMGVDRHMEEILRVAEQTAMTAAEFSNFLRERGFTEAEISEMQQGERDIPILTGPHLGGFNQGISVPELIAFTAMAAALCVSDRFCNEKSGRCPAGCVFAEHPSQNIRDHRGSGSQTPPR